MNQIIFFTLILFGGLYSGNTDEFVNRKKWNRDAGLESRKDYWETRHSILDVPTVPRNVSEREKTKAILDMLIMRFTNKNNKNKVKLDSKDYMSQRERRKENKKWSKNQHLRIEDIKNDGHNDIGDKKNDNSELIGREEGDMSTDRDNSAERNKTLVRERQDLSNTDDNEILRGGGRPRLPTVMYQLAQEANTTKITTLDPREEQKRLSTEELNPYSLLSQLRKLVKKIRHTNITLSVVGRTAGYNDIVLIRAEKGKDESEKSFRATENKFVEEEPEKKIIFIVHGLSVMGFTQVPCLIMAAHFEKLLKTYFNHLDKFNILLIPLANPDGVAYSSNFQYWNKNTSPQDACPGVAVDRNFDVAFDSGPKLQSCSQHYQGEIPFSEPESIAVREIFHKYSHKIIAYINVHAGSYHKNVFRGDAVLYPKGFSDNQSDDDRYIDLKGDIDEAMKNANLKVMSVSVDTLYNWYGKVTGSSVDYASSVYGIPFALELVMQLYEPGAFGKDINHPIAAFTVIWNRVIDVIFKNVYKTIENNSEENQNK